MKCWKLRDWAISSLNRPHLEPRPRESLRNIFGSVTRTVDIPRRSFRMCDWKLPSRNVLTCEPFRTNSCVFCRDQKHAVHWINFSYILMALGDMNSYKLCQFSCIIRVSLSNSREIRSGISAVIQDRWRSKYMSSSKWSGFPRRKPSSLSPYSSTYGDWSMAP